MRSEKMKQRAYYKQHLQMIRFLNHLYLYMFQQPLEIIFKVKRVKKDIRKLLKNRKIERAYLEKLEIIEEELLKDVSFFQMSDPVTSSEKEIILTYPGVHAIFGYRVAHLLSELEVDLLPRMISELTHERTGIDIHPKSIIGCPFFIDHGTGVVIGETTKIGNYVKIYQGVTLGASNLEHIEHIRGTKRHPTIGNHVIIYAGAKVLGGDTFIPDDVTIGEGVTVTKKLAIQLAERTLIYQVEGKVYVKEKDS